jgi:hypothetical protein
MAGDMKSLRLEERVANLLKGKDINFSQTANDAIEQHLRNKVWIPNFKIHEYADISANELLERTKHVKFLRTNDSAVKFSLYPTTEDEMTRNQKIHDYVNGNFNTIHDSYVYFNLQFPIELYLFLSSRQWTEVERFIYGFLCFLLWDQSEYEKKLMEEQLDHGILKRIMKVVKGDDFKQLELAYKKYLRTSDPLLKAEYNIQYYRLMIKLGIDPLMFKFVKPILSSLHYPLHYKEHIVSGTSQLRIKIDAAYMRDVYESTDDWQSIVVTGKDKTDKLLRSESKEEPWKIWEAEYSFLHYRQLNPSPSKRRKKS